MQNITTHYLYGYYPVLAALEANKRKFYCLFLDNKLQHTKQEAEFLLLAKKRGVSIKYQSSDNLSKLCNQSQHQHLVLQAGSLPCMTLENLLKNKNKKNHKKNLWVGLEHLHSPQNIGAILRTCLYFHIDHIFLTKQQTCSLSSAVSKSSAGAMEKLSFCRAMNFSMLIKRLKKENFWIVGTSLAGENFVKQDIPDNCFLIFGNEKKGIQPLVKKTCDFLWKIEGGGTNSLNVSATSAIILHHIYNANR